MEAQLHTLEVLLEALDASRLALRRDVCGDRAIVGRAGHIYACGDSFLIYASPLSRRRWTSIKRHLRSFCRLTQDGDDEGCLMLDRLPSPPQAALIRDAIRLKRRRRLSPHQRALARSNLKRGKSPAGEASRPAICVISGSR